MFDNLLGSALTSVGIVVALVILALVAFKSRYKTVSPDKAMIVTGSFLGSRNVVGSGEDGKDQRKVKIISGGGSFVLPIFQDFKFLSLLSHKIDVETPEVYTEEGVPIIANATAIIKIRGTMEDIFSAAERYLGKTEDVLRSEATEVLEGHLRSILGSMTVEEIYKNRDKFGQQVQEVSAKDLKKMGLSIDSFTIKDVKDKHGYLEALGKPRIAQVKRDAEIAEAEATKEATISKAKAEEQWKQAELQRDVAVAEAEKEKDLRVASFKLEADKAKAEANAAYGIQEALSEQQVIEAKMKAQQIQKEKDIELEEKEAIRMQRHLEATIHKQADADLYQRTQAAEASKIEQETAAAAQAQVARTKAQAEAEAQRVRAEAEAEAEKRKGQASAEVVRMQGIAEADAKKAQTEIVKAQGEMEAAAEKARIENLSAEGQATAAAIEAKGLAEAKVAEARAQADILREKGLAEAKLSLGQILILEELIKSLPEVAGKIAEPMGNIDKITIVDAGGNGDGISKMTSSVTNLMHTLPELMKSITGVDMGAVLKNLSGGRLSGDAFDPASFANIAKSLKGVDGSFADTLSTLLQDNPAVAQALLGGGEASAATGLSDEASGKGKAK